MNTDCRPTNSWDFRLRATKVGGVLSMRSLAALSLTVALIALLATLATLPAPPLQAQSLGTFVSNTGGSGVLDSDDFQAQSFETGANAGSYTVSEVILWLGDASGKSTSVSIKEDNGGEPGDLVTTLANPGTLTSHNFNIFTAQPVITLAASTTYWITVNEGISSDRMPVSNTSADDESSVWGWSIGDGRLFRTSETDIWSDSTRSLLIEISGTISADARLSALALEGADGGEAITLSPAFATGKYTYTAAVVNRIDAVKLTATQNDDNATVVITNDDDTGTRGEALLDLSVGSNTLTVTVTAQDGTPLTYTITVERHTTTTLVSNTHLSATDAGSNEFQAQSFEAGTNADGYMISEVQIRLAANDTGASTSVKIRENNGGEPGDLVATLTNPGTLTADSLNTFTAPAGTRLDASTTYWLTVNEGISSNRTNFSHIGEDEEAGEPGWTIGNGRRARTSEMGDWSFNANSLMIEIKGTPVPATTLVSNTHLRWETRISSTTITAQSFETGANLGGYTVSEVDLALTAVSSVSSTIVKIRENNGGAPGELVTTLTNPGTLTEYSLNTFTAPPGTTLAASTTYWLTMGEGISINRVRVETSLGNDETGEPGWSIGNDRLFKIFEADEWETTSNSLLMTIKGTAVPTTLVSNTHLTPSGNVANYEAQSFETGTNAGGYTVSGIDMQLGIALGTNTTVKIRENNADNEPGDLVATLTNPGTLTENSLNTFLAQDTITLDPRTTYWISVNEGISTSVTAVFGTTGGDAETGETGWTIGDSRLWREDETASWFTSGSSLVIAIKGTAVPCDGIWCATLTVQGLGSGHRGCGNSSTGNECSNAAHLSEDEFTHASTPYSVTAARVQSGGQLQLYLSPDITTDSQTLVLHVGSETFAFEDANVKEANHRRWNNSGLSWSTGDAIALTS